MKRNFDSVELPANQVVSHSYNEKVLYVYQLEKFLSKWNDLTAVVSFHFPKIQFSTFIIVDRHRCLFFFSLWLSFIMLFWKEGILLYGMRLSTTDELLLISKNGNIYRSRHQTVNLSLSHSVLSCFKDSFLSFFNNNRKVFKS